MRIRPISFRLQISEQFHDLRLHRNVQCGVGSSAISTAGSSAIAMRSDACRSRRRIDAGRP